MTRGHSFSIATAAMLGIYSLSYLFHLVIAGSFAIPANVATILVPLTPLIDYLAAFAIHGLLSGGWSLPAPFTPPPAQEIPPSPPASAAN